MQAPGALFSCGDAHAAQGDGEVCVTGIESPIYAALRFNLIKVRSIPAPQFVTPGPLTSKSEGAGWYATMGIGPNLMQATKDSMRAMVEHVSTTYHMEPVESYVLASLAVDLKINEVVDQPNWISPRTCRWRSSGNPLTVNAKFKVGNNEAYPAPLSEGTSA